MKHFNTIINLDSLIIINAKMIITYITSTRAETGHLSHKQANFPILAVEKCVLHRHLRIIILIIFKFKVSFERNCCNLAIAYLAFSHASAITKIIGMMCDVPLSISHNHQSKIYKTK